MKLFPHFPHLSTLFYIETLFFFHRDFFCINPVYCDELIAIQPFHLLIDQCLSALDFQTDARLRRALKKEITGAIVLIVAQRVSTIMDADQIIVLNEGKIAGRGTHRELLKTCPLYHEIAASQLSEEELQYEV